MKSKFFGLTAIIFSSHLQAQVVTPDTTFGEAVTITATKNIRKQSETGKVVIIINKQTLQNSLGKTVSEILNQQAGLFIAGSNNALGANQDIYVRGSGKILFLLDGIPIYDASTISNTFDINSINIESLERIEILKGAQSTLYGSDAVAGVVNFITNKIITSTINRNIGFSAGSFNTYKASAGVYGKADDVTYSLQLTHLNSKGFSAAYDSVGNKKFDKDGYKQTTLNGSISGALAKNFLIGLNTQLSAYNADVDGGAFTDDKDYTVNNINFNANINAQVKTKKGKVIYNLGTSTANRYFLNDSIDKSGFADYVEESYNGKSNFMELYTTQQLHKNVELIAGADYRWLNSDQNYLAISAYGPYETKVGKDSMNQQMQSVYASLLFKNSTGFNMEVGGRYNKHSNYGNNTTFTFNPSYTINSKTKIFANVSSAFKAPSLYQLFGPDVANNKLKAEKSLTYEAGIEYTKANKNIRIVYFNRNIKDGIDYNLNTFTYFNNNQQNDFGIEIEAMAKWNKFTANANYTYLDGKVNTWKFVYNPSTFEYDIKGDTTFNNLFRRPKHSINISATYKPTENWQLSLNTRSIGKRYEGQFLAKPITLSSYITLDAGIAYLFKNKSRIYADVRNLTNQKYFDVWGYNAKQINFTVGFQYIF
jgi:vitamin B12 transporter